MGRERRRIPSWQELAAPIKAAYNCADQPVPLEMATLRALRDYFRFARDSSTTRKAWVSHLVCQSVCILAPVVPRRIGLMLFRAPRTATTKMICDLSSLTTVFHGSDSNHPAKNLCEMTLVGEASRNARITDAKLRIAKISLCTF